MKTVWLAIGTLGPGAWRYTCLIGVLPALVAFWIRRNIPESPRWEPSNQQRRAAHDLKRQGAVLQGEDAAIVRFTLVDMFADPAVRSRQWLTFAMSLSVTIGSWGVAVLSRAMSERSLPRGTRSAALDSVGRSQLETLRRKMRARRLRLLAQIPKDICCRRLE
jgi:hypothetical protein